MILQFKLIEEEDHMHTKSRAMLGVLLVIIALLVGSTVEPVLKAQAGMGAQSSTPLAGYRIYFSEDNAEASRFERSEAGLSRFGGLLQGLGAELFTLEWRDRIPTDADLVVIAGPMWNLSTWRIARLWVYLNSGGRLLLLGDVIGDPASPGLPAASGVFELLWIDMGLRGRDDIIVKEDQQRSGLTQAGAGSSQQQSALSFFASANFTTSNFNASHPITKGLKGEVAFSVARSLEISGTSAPFRVTPLVFSDADYYGETTLPQDARDEQFQYSYDSLVDTPVGALPLAAAIEGLASSTRIVVIGDREFATNGGGIQTSSADSFSFVYPNNVQFMLNAVTWLLDTDPIDLSVAAELSSEPTSALE
jgi:hypothetical protein